ncbi:MAG: LysM peptidoglycan-binding domain-containing protein [Firmicutes bacterium]|nr:LysM peptidoglycan-binding domain-containing protein [Bacillota bacterium]
MNDYKIVIDAGHGGDDPGASGNEIVEKDLNLDIANYMYDRFKGLGIPVKIIRTTDETISPTERTERVLNAFGNDSDVILLSNHINAGGGEGAEVIYALRNTDTLPNLILNKIGDTGQIIRKAYQRRLPSNPSKDYYFMQRNTGDVQSLTIEYGFLDNANDAAKLKSNWQEYVDAVVEAVLEYIGMIPSGTTYTVKNGDSLWSIAKKFDISVEELKAANNLNNNLLNIDQILKIPDKAVDSGDYIVYTVKRGDSLYSIARDYGVSVNQLIDYNNLSSNNLSINQQILIPKKEEADLSNTYTVKSGDTLYSIARNYNTTVNELMSLNNLTTSVLSLGQVLKLPSGVDDGGYIEYVVKSGDSLYVIAQKFNTSADEIKRLNNLSTNLLSIGQVLQIPNTGESETYIVKSGDSLYSIARKFNTTVNEIKQKNNLTSNLLNIGQVLII